MSKSVVAQMEEIVIDPIAEEEPVAKPVKAKAAEPIELPSRPFLDDGVTPNPKYDRTLDPGSGAWQPAKYFDLRDQVRIHIRGDYENPQITTVSCSINGYSQTWPVNTDQVVPIDFAEILIERRTAWRVG